MYKVSGRRCSNGNVETPEPRCYIQMPVLDEQPAVHCSSFTLIDWKVNEHVLPRATANFHSFKQEHSLSYSLREHCFMI